MAKRDEYLDTMEDLIGHPGWKLLEDEFRKRIYQLQADALDIQVCKSWDHVNECRGAARVLAEFIRFPEQLAVLRDSANDAEAGE